MPSAPLRYCSAPGGCQEQVTSGRCPKHQRQARHHEQRFQRGNYGRPWRRLRDAFIQQQVDTVGPWCVECLKSGLKVVFDEVDHIVPHRGDPVLRDDVRNLQLLCKPHHSAKTAAETIAAR